MNRFLEVVLIARQKKQELEKRHIKSYRDKLIKTEKARQEIIEEENKYITVAWVEE